MLLLVAISIDAMVVVAGGSIDPIGEEKLLLACVQLWTQTFSQLDQAGRTLFGEGYCYHCTATFD